MTITRIPRPRFGLPEIKSCAEKTKFRNSTRISDRNLRGKDKIPQPPAFTGNDTTGSPITENRQTGYYTTGDETTGYRATGCLYTGCLSTGHFPTGYSTTGYSFTAYTYGSGTQSTLKEPKIAGFFPHFSHPPFPLHALAHYFALPWSTM